MALNDSRTEALKKKHEQLDEQIAEEQKRPVPCSVELRRLKRQKLRLKDELQTA